MIISLRFWLVSSFATVILIYLAGIFLFLSYVDKEKIIEDYYSNLKTTRILLLESNKLKDDIFIGENNEEIFFLGSNSSQELSFKNLEKKTGYHIHLLNHSEITSTYLLNQKVDTLKSNYFRYLKTYHALIQLYKLKGFKNYGIEGKMREHAHNIYNYNNIQVKLLCLLLRKHEKDFLLRKDLLYVHEFEKVHTSLKDYIRGEQSIPQKDKTYLLNSLNLYNGYFNKLSGIEVKIGIKGSGGYLNQSKKEFDEIARIIEQMDNELKQIKTDHTKQFKHYTMITIVIIITFLLVVILILSQFIMRSIKYISASFTNYVNAGFDFDSIAYRQSKIKEFNAIYTSFLKMAKEINIFTNFFKEKVLERTKAITLQKDEILAQQLQIKEQYDALYIKSVELNEQKQLLISKDNDLQESLRYAKRIQKAIQPGASKLKKKFKDSFVFSKAKDVVSGDFCLVYKLKDKEDPDNERFVFVASDCTGHGVPGAMMSVLGINTLHKIVKKLKNADPGRILNLLNRNINQVLIHGKGKDLIADGMDIAVFSFDPRSYLLEYSIAKFPYLLIRGKTIIHLNTQKYSIGYNFLENGLKKFETSSIQLIPGDRLYLFSDGFQDQFGGVADKKFKKNNLVNLLLSMDNVPMEDQKTRMTNEFIAWKGSNVQTDDILLLGIKF